jgi:hypothetical protein
MGPSAGPHCSPIFFQAILPQHQEVLHLTPPKQTLAFSEESSEDHVDFSKFYF